MAFLLGTMPEKEDPFVNFVAWLTSGRLRFFISVSADRFRSRSQLFARDSKAISHSYHLFYGRETP